MKLFKVPRYDKVLAPILMAFSVVASAIGVLLITKMIKLVDQFPIPSIAFCWILLTISVLCLIYSIVIIILVYKKFNKILTQHIPHSKPILVPVVSFKKQSQTN